MPLGSISQALAITIIILNWICKYFISFLTEHEPVVVPKEIVDELAGLRIAYADLSIQYEKELQNSPEAQLKLAEYSNSKGLAYRT